MVVGLLGNKILVLGSSGLLGAIFTKKFKNKLNLVTLSLKSNSDYNVDISNIKELSLLTNKLDIKYIVNFKICVVSTYEESF